jgi:hypothetical protein
MWAYGFNTLHLRRAVTHLFLLLLGISHTCIMWRYCMYVHFLTTLHIPYKINTVLHVVFLQMTTMQYGWVCYQMQRVLICSTWTIKYIVCNGRCHSLQWQKNRDVCDNIVLINTFHISYTINLVLNVCYCFCFFYKLQGSVAWFRS